MAAEGSAIGAGGIGAASVPVAAAGAAGAAPPHPQDGAALQPQEASQPQLLQLLQQLLQQHFLWQWKMSSKPPQ